MLSAYCVLGVLHVPLHLRCTCRGGEGSYHPPVYTGGSGSSGRPGSLSKVTDLVRALCDSKVFLLSPTWYCLAPSSSPSRLRCGWPREHHFLTVCLGKDTVI